jgi:sigma-B regulation protein RsbU (phosphoserine phosphatase)
LASIIGAQAGVVLEQAALREQAIERKRLQAEMDLARNIQQKLLPAGSPDVINLDIAGANRPATETSGDYFDYIALNDGRLGLVIADVTGHGLGAALVMTAARAFVRACCTALNDPAQITSAVNKLLEKDLDAGNFLSLCLACFDVNTLELHYASAGHDPPFVYRPGVDEFMELESTGPLLGIMADMEFGVGGPLQLAKGDVLVFMTDGLFECMNASDETFGKDRLRAIIKENCAKTADEMVAALLHATSEWTGQQPPRDDITLVVVKVKP